MAGTTVLSQPLERLLERYREGKVTALRAAGVDAVTLANNHAYDQGLRGLRNTLAATERESLPSIGVGDDASSAAERPCSARSPGTKETRRPVARTGSGPRSS